MAVDINVRTSGLTTSGESVIESRQTAAHLRDKILELASEAHDRGLTINEAERLIDDHKANSVSPRFAELVRRGLLVRVFVGLGKPSERFPKGAPRYRTRFDEETERNVIIHWLREYAPEEIETDETIQSAGIQ